MADFIKLNDLLKDVNWDTITEENSFEDLPEGYYLCEVDWGVIISSISVT